MWLFGKKETDRRRNGIPSMPHPSLAASIEIAANKEASQEAVQKAKKASADLKDLLVENGFTLTMVLVAGGQHPHK